jgi:hypothetical protein
MAERGQRRAVEPPPLALDPAALAALVELLVDVALAEREQPSSEDDDDNKRKPTDEGTL